MVILLFCQILVHYMHESCLLYLSAVRTLSFACAFSCQTDCYHLLADFS